MTKVAFPDLRDKNCDRCELHDSALTVCMMGVGPKTAKIVLLGEAPGANEDSGGEPFVGASGTLLMKALDALAGIKREDVYITNVNKCRPPDNRTPKTPEIKMCRESYLEEELARISPDYVLTLGNVPLKALTGKSGITKLAGQIIERKLSNGHLTKVFPSLHPAAVLRNPTLSQAFGMDIERFGKVVRGEKTGLDTDVTIVSNKTKLVELRRHLMMAKEIAWDVETFTYPEEGKVRSGLQEWHGDRSQIVSVSFSWEEGQAWVVPLYHPIHCKTKSQFIRFGVEPDQEVVELASKFLRYLKPALERTDCKYIGHNVKFDCRWMQSKGVFIPQTADTMLMCHTLDENAKKDLKTLSKAVLGADAYDVGEEVKNAIGMDLDTICTYNGKDTDYTLRLYHHFRARLAAKPENYRKVFTTLTMPASRALTAIETNGAWLDMERWEERRAESVVKRQELYDFIQRQVPESLRPLNVNSPKQIANVLFDYMGLPVIEETATGAPSTGKTSMTQLAGMGYKLPTAILKYRKWNKRITTYFDPWVHEHMNPATGRIMSSYKVAGTVTGRLSGTGGIQQVPRDVFMRSLIGAPKGWKFVSVDYSQLELRVAAWVANDETMLRLFREGVDSHKYMGLQILRLENPHATLDDVSKDHRSLAKPVNFGYLFEMGETKFIEYALNEYGIVVTPEQSHELREVFFSTFRQLKGWHTRQRNEVRKYHEVTSLFGRVRHLPDALSSDEGLQAAAEREGINAPVQGVGSDFGLLALIELERMTRGYEDEIKLIGTVHDAILSEIKDEYVEKWAPVIKATMEDTERVERQMGCGPIPVPIVVDVEVGQHWGEGKEWSA